MKRNEESDDLFREDWSQVYGEMPDSVRDGVVYASASCVCLENIAREVSLTDGQ